MEEKLQPIGLVFFFNNVVFNIEGFAPDGTPEAIYVKGAAGFTLSVQWHPEWDAANDPVSRPLFEAFGNAVREFAAARRRAPQRISA